MNGTSISAIMIFNHINAKISICIYIIALICMYVQHLQTYNILSQMMKASTFWVVTISHCFRHFVQMLTFNSLNGPMKDITIIIPSLPFFFKKMTESSNYPRPQKMQSSRTCTKASIPRIQALNHDTTSLCLSPRCFMHKLFFVVFNRNA